ncbi:MAG: TauD/TfdA family dioxygenase [Ectothiorhodospiraceae bacterium]|nr:TauD/TfdA family dioxygenase [Ectothiorhodospiraceae bacterium]
MSSALPVAIEDSCAWRGPEIRGDSRWMRRFDDAELAELARAVDAVRGARPFEFGAVDFPLPTLGPALRAIARDLESGLGLVHLRGLDLDGLSTDDIDRLYAGIGCHLGHVITQNTRGDRIGRVTDRGTDYSQAAQRGHTSNGEILPHCDTADVVGLLCVHPAMRGGESKVASAVTVYNEIAARHPEYLPVLHRGFRINLAGKGPSGDPEECSNHVIPVFSHFAGRLSCRYNKKQIEDAARILGHTLSPLEQAAIAAVGDIAMRDDVRLDMDFRRGDIQLLNNHALLHARGAYDDGPDPERRRLLLRMWINIPESRPLAPEFADRLNTGPRGEVAVLRGRTNSSS